jgi:vacuolar-type H+-ATPase subunit F/Vma7
MIVVGNRRLVLPLTAAGFEPRRVRDAAELESALDRLSVDKTAALVVCGESQAAGCPEALDRFRRRAHGVLLVVPDGPEPAHLGREALRLAIEQAAGVDLLGRSREGAAARTPEQRDEHGMVRFL